MQFQLSILLKCVEKLCVCVFVRAAIGRTSTGCQTPALLVFDKSSKTTIITIISSETRGCQAMHEAIKGFHLIATVAMTL